MKKLEVCQLCPKFTGVCEHYSKAEISAWAKEKAEQLNIIAHAHDHCICECPVEEIEKEFLELSG